MSGHNTVRHRFREWWRQLRQHGVGILDALEGGPYSQLYDSVRSLERQVAELQNRLEHQVEGALNADVAAAQNARPADPISS